MPTYQITDPSGATYEIDGPEGATQDQVIAAIGAHKQAQGPSALRSGMEGLLQGGTLGTWDEIEGAIRAGLDKAQGSPQSFGDLYGQEVQVPRQRMKASAEAHPYAYHGAEIAGGIGSGLALGGVGIPARAGMLARSIYGAGEGAALGGIYGGASAEGGAQNRAEGAAQGIATGAMLGGATPAAVDVASSALGAITRPIRGMLQPQEVAHEKVAEALGRDFGAPGDVRQTQRALSRIDQRVANANTDKPMMLADYGGQNTRDLLRAAANMPNSKVQALNQSLNTRQGGQWRRIESDLAAGLGNPNEYRAALDQVVAERANDASTNFQKAFATQTPMTPRLQEVLDRPLMKDLVKKIDEEAANRGIRPTYGSNTQAFQAIKEEIDTMIGAAKKAAAVGADRTAARDARTYQTLKSDFLDAIDNPDYKDALKSYAGDSALKNAAEDGFDEALKIPTEDLAQKMRNLQGSEADMYRLGAARALAQKIRTGNVTRDRTENIFSSPDMQNRLQALFPDEASRREFQKNLTLEARMADTRKAVQGNSTTAKQLMQAQEAGNPSRAISAVANAAAGRFEGLLSGLARVGQRFSGMTPATANATIDTLMQPANRGTMALGNALRQAMMHADQVPANRAQLSNALIAGGQPLIGRQTLGPNSEYDPYR